MAALVLVGIRFGIVVIFAVSVAGKVRGSEAFAGFRQSLAKLGYIPSGLLNAVAIGIVLAEAIAIPLVVVPAASPVGLAWAGTLMVTFAVGISIAKYRGQLVPCHCFGVRTRPLGRPDVVRNLVVGGLCGWAAVLALGADIPPVTTEAVGVAIIGGIAGILITAADDLLVLLKP